jgi:hypothetical protein
LKTLTFSGSNFNSLSRICPTISELVVDIDSIATRKRIVLSELISFFPCLKNLKLETSSDFPEFNMITFTTCDNNHNSVQPSYKSELFATLEELSLNHCDIASEVDFSEFNRLKKLIMCNCTMDHVLHLGPSIEHFAFTVLSKSEQPIRIDIQTKQLIYFECHRPLDIESLPAFQDQHRLTTLKLHSGPFSYVSLGFCLEYSPLLTRNIHYFLSLF